MFSSRLIYEAMSFYEKKGYRFKSVPFVVDEEVSKLTRPKRICETYHDDRVYSGSGEQGFLQLLSKQALPAGKWQALTPCVRDEAILSDKHYHVFLKLELINVGSDDVNAVLRDAEAFWASQGVNTDRECTQAGIDLYASEIEIGSYGSMTAYNTTYVYGTGVSEPRGSLVLNNDR
jgi:hypothetical protein